MQNILETHQLTKTINKKDLVKNVDIHVRKGEIYGFLGPNGAGKTTVMKMLTNLWKPTYGTIELFGETLTPTSYAVLKRMGSIIEFPQFYDHMSGQENLQLHCEYMGYCMPGCVEESLALLGLSDAAGKKVKEYSLGMRQRLGIARAVLCRPELLVLDEPINGLDPQGIIEMRQLLLNLNQKYGITILISSHNLDELSRLATHYGFINNGKMVKEISAKDLENSFRKSVRIEVTNGKALAAVLEQAGLPYKILAPNVSEVYSRVNISKLTSALEKYQCEVLSIKEQEENLESYYVNLIGGVSHE